MDFIIRMSQSLVCRIVVSVLVIIIILLIIFWPRETSDSNDSSEFTCPTDTNYVNCMPQIADSEEDREATENQAAYCKFIEDNCPDISVVY